MKLVYDDGELDRLKEVYDTIRDNGLGGALFGDYNPETIYGITFKITKPEIAEYVLFGLLRNRLDNFDIGIDVQSIEFNLISNRDELKDKLHKAIDSIMS